MQDESRDYDIGFINEIFSEDIRAFSISLGVDFCISEISAKTIGIKVLDRRKKYSSRNGGAEEHKSIVYAIRNRIIDKIVDVFPARYFEVEYNDEFTKKTERFSGPFLCSGWEKEYFTYTNHVLEEREREGLANIFDSLSEELNFKDNRV